jgi:hypothetical protein
MQRPLELGVRTLRHIPGHLRKIGSNDSKNQQNRPKSHALGFNQKTATALVWRFRSPHHSCSESEMPSTDMPSIDDGARRARALGHMAMLPRIFLAWLEQIQQSLR